MKMKKLKQANARVVSSHNDPTKQRPNKKAGPDEAQTCTHAGKQGNHIQPAHKDIISKLF